MLEETATRARELGFDQQLTSTLHSLGDLSLDRSDPDTALRRFAEALAYAVATGSRRIQIYCVAGIACALLLRGDERAAARLWGIAEDQERRLGFRMLLNERQRYESLISDARERLGSRTRPSTAPARDSRLSRQSPRRADTYRPDSRSHDCATCDAPVAAAGRAQRHRATTWMGRLQFVPAGASQAATETFATMGGANCETSRVDSSRHR